MRCASLVVPSARLVSTWVSPRVKRPEPWTRGSTRTSQLIGRISSALRPSGRSLSTAMRSRMSRFWSDVERRAEGRGLLGVGVVAEDLLGGGRADRGDLVAAGQLGLLAGGLGQVLARALLDLREELLVDGRRPRPPTWACPPLSRSSIWAAQRRRISSWAIWSASSIVSSSTSLAPASTIEMASSVPATMRSSSDSSLSCTVGLMMNSSPTRPMRTAPDRALEGQLREHQRGRGPVDAEDVERVHLIDREHRRDHLGLVAVALGPERPDRPVGHARRQGRAVARPRLALDEAAGDLARRRTSAPRTSTVRGKKSAPGRGSCAPTAVTSTTVSPERTTTDAVRLLGKLARLELDRHVADLDGHLLYCHFTSLVCPAPRRSASMCPRRPAPALCLVLSSLSRRPRYLRRPSCRVSSR